MNPTISVNFQHGGFGKSPLRSIIKSVMSLTSGSTLKTEKHLVMGAVEIYFFYSKTSE